MSDLKTYNSIHAITVPLLDLEDEDSECIALELPPTEHRGKGNAIIVLFLGAFLAGLVYMSGMQSALAGAGIILSAASIACLLSHMSREASLDWLLTIVLPFFVFGQYYASLLDHTEADMPGGLPLEALAATAIYLIVSLMYRKVLQDNRSTIESLWILHLLPEVMAVSTILLTYVGEVSGGLFCLLGGESLLVVVALCILAHRRTTAIVKTAPAIVLNDDEAPPMDPYTAVTV